MINWNKTNTEGRCYHQNLGYQPSLAFLSLWSSSTKLGEWRAARFGCSVGTSMVPLVISYITSITRQTFSDTSPSDSLSSFYGCCWSCYHSLVSHSLLLLLLLLFLFLFCTLSSPFLLIVPFQYATATIFVWTQGSAQASASTQLRRRSTGVSLCRRCRPSCMWSGCSQLPQAWPDRMTWYGGRCEQDE